jgi:hypothetical protein
LMSTHESHFAQFDASNMQKESFIKIEKEQYSGGSRVVEQTNFVL